MTESPIPCGAVSESPQPFESEISDIRERIDAIFAWQLSEGDYELRIPPRPPSVPDKFKHDTTINATDLIFSLGKDDKGREQKVTITRGLTENWAGAGLAEKSDDVTIDISGSPTVFRIKPNEETVDSFDLETNPQLPHSRTYSKTWEGDAYYGEYDMVPRESRPFNQKDVVDVNFVLDAIGIPGDSSLPVKVVETHRNRVMGLWQKR